MSTKKRKSRRIRGIAATAEPSPADGVGESVELKVITEIAAAGLEDGGSEQLDDSLCKKLFTDDKAGGFGQTTAEEEQSSDDDQPEAISLKDSRQTADDALRLQRDAINLAKEQKKRKRKYREKINAERKKEKRQRLIAKLPEEILESIAVDDSKNSQKAKKDIAARGIDNTQQEREESVGRESTESGIASIESAAIAVPHIKPVVLRDCYNKTKPVKVDAVRFLHQHFYGSRLERSNNSQSFRKCHQARFGTFDC